MRRFDVFNGDADGLCALQQLRLAEPADSVLVCGPKRDIELLARVDAGRGDLVTVLDISLDRNRTALQSLLARGVRVRYFDHHYAGVIPRDPLLEAHIETGAGRLHQHPGGPPPRRPLAPVGDRGRFRRQPRRPARPSLRGPSPSSPPRWPHCANSARR